MRAYKFFGDSRRGRFSGYVWPAPEAGQPGAWVEVTGPLEPCRRGIHACRANALAHWLDGELWAVELDGSVLEQGTIVVAPRGRLLARVEGWDAALQQALMDDCLARTEQLVERFHRAGGEGDKARAYVREVAKFREQQNFATAAYVSAVAASLLEADPDGAYEAERRHQSDWLSARLSL